MQEKDIGQGKRCIRGWDSGLEIGEIEIHDYNQKEVVIKNRCRYQQQNPTDQVDLEFQIMSFLNERHSNLVLPNMVCFEQNYKSVLFLGFALWHPKNMARHIIEIKF